MQWKQGMSCGLVGIVLHSRVNPEGGRGSTPGQGGMLYTCINPLEFISLFGSTMSIGTSNSTDPLAYRGGGVSFGYPKGYTLMDLVPDDVKPLIHSHWSKFPPVNPMWHYILAGIYIILGCLSFFGNGIVMYLFLSKKSLRSPANMFVVNLAFSDFMMMASQFPMFIVNCFGGGYWSLGALACQVYGFLGSVFGLTSLITLVGIGYDRYCVIVKAFDGGHIGSGKAFIIIVLCWALLHRCVNSIFRWNSYIPEGILTSCSFDYISHDWNIRSFGIFLIVMCYCIPLTIIIFVYSQIVGAIRQHEKALRDQAKKMNVENLRSNADTKKQSAEVRIAKVAVANVFLWLLTWTPYAYVVMIGLFGDQEKVTPLVSALPALIAKTASVYNPIMFAISHPKFRLALQETLPWFCVHEEKDDDTKSSKTETEAPK
ncbi:compound eye opsin BCRH2-like [Penaeus japonicus]|uniref:compound eye opsin BCRH2-like n=1 Tax=Penaeus japonicus TaxID=27405 RepID=UPI001C71674F|nr:compound eye opsin BCRH2-like [Penaeus japonicus]